MFNLYMQFQFFRKYKRKNKLKDTLIYQIYPESGTLYRITELVSSSQWAHTHTKKKTNRLKKDNNRMQSVDLWFEQSNTGEKLGYLNIDQVSY